MRNNEVIYYPLSLLKTSAHSGSVLHCSAIDFRETGFCSLFCCSKIPCLFLNTNKWGDQASCQVLRTFPHKSNICAYCSSRLQKLERRKENSKLHSLFYGMKNTAADHYCSEARLTINVSGLDEERCIHTDESRSPKRSFHWVQHSLPILMENTRTIEMPLASESPTLKCSQPSALLGTPKFQSQSPFVPEMTKYSLSWKHCKAVFRFFCTSDMPEWNIRRRCDTKHRIEYFFRMG